MLGLGIYFFWIISASVFVNWKENACVTHSWVCTRVWCEFSFQFRNLVGVCVLYRKAKTGEVSFYPEDNKRRLLKSSVPTHQLYRSRQMQDCIWVPQCWQDWATDAFWSLEFDAGLAWTFLSGGWHLHLSALLTRDPVPCVSGELFLVHIHKRNCAQHRACPSEQPAQPHQELGAAAVAQEPSQEHSQSSLSWLRLSLLTLRNTTLLGLRAELRQDESHCSWAAMLTMAPRAPPHCVWLPWSFLLRAAENEPVKAHRNQQLPWFPCTKLQNWSQALCTQECTDDIAPSVYDIHGAFLGWKKPARPNGWMEKRMAASWFKGDI